VLPEAGVVENTFSVGLVLPVYVAKRDMLLLGSDFAWDDISVRSGPYADQSILRLSPVAAWLHQFGAKETVVAFAVPIVSKELNGNEPCGASGYGGVIGMHWFSEQFQMLYGGVYEYSYGQSTGYPYLGVMWSPSPKWSLAVVFPWPSLTYTPRDRWLFQAGLAPGGSSWVRNGDGYQTEESLSSWNLTAGGTLSSQNAIQGNFLNAGAQAIYTDRPTITYTPMTGHAFLRGLMTPIEPKNIFFMLQSGYPADFILGMTVESLNGLHNRSAMAGAVREADPEFVRVLQLLREVQVAGGVGMRVQENKDKTETAVMFFRRDNVPPEILDKAGEIRRLLKLPDDQQQFNLIYSPVPGTTNELAVGSRSMVQIMTAMSSYTDVPEADLKDGRATPSLSSTNGAGNRDPVEINCGQEKPADAFSAVHYRNHWFWVDDRDWRTKRAFTAIMFLFTMAETGGNEKLPLITIPAQ
jgi:hypothetical protein